jgi:hypothetical protein
MDEREVVGSLAFVTNEQRAKAVVPAIGSFDDPATGSPANATHERRFTAASNVRDHATIVDGRVPVRVEIEDGAFSRVNRNPGTTPDRTGGMRLWRNVPGT